MTRSQHIIPRAALITSCIFSLVGCAAMVRTWSFGAEPVQGSRLKVTVTKAKVKQKDVYVTLRIKNHGPAPLRVKVGTFTLKLPDGEEVRGKTGLIGRAAAGVKGVLSSWGAIKKQAEPKLAAGGTLTAELAFRQSHRDLRRQPRLTIDLSAIRVEGQSAQLPKLVLVAPDDAPMGEHI
jgi:hypothetical protein